MPSEGVFKMKEEYEKLSMNVVIFKSADVISDSGWEDETSHASSSSSTSSDPTELPPTPIG